MNREKAVETMMNSVNVLIILMIVLLYVATGTTVGDDAVAALSKDTTVYRGTAEGSVALECAVSWDAAALPEMLEVLDAAGVHATFFVSGQWAKDNAQLLERIAESGHEIGTMGYYPTFDGDVSTVVSDVELSQSVIETITGISAEYYYSGLRSAETSRRAAEEAGLKHVACTTDLLSGRGDAVDIASRALEHIFDGSILLIQPTAAAVRALPTILSEIASRGYRVTTVGNVLQ